MAWIKKLLNVRKEKDRHISRQNVMSSLPDQYNYKRVKDTATSNENNIDNKQCFREVLKCACSRSDLLLGFLLALFTVLSFSVTDVVTSLADGKEPNGRLIRCDYFDNCTCSAQYSDVQLTKLASSIYSKVLNRCRHGWWGKFFLIKKTSDSIFYWSFKKNCFI